VIGKQKEIMAREAYFIQVAREILLRDGYQGVTINRIAETTGFSKGTVYQRFGSKEELITAIGIECRIQLLDAIRRAANFPGPPRERMVALGETLSFYSKFHADGQRILKIIDSEAILQKVPDEQRQQMQAYDIQMFQAVLGIIEDAIAAGDLALSADSSPQGLCFGFWAMMDGSFDASMGGAPLKETGIENPTAEVVLNSHYLMDGYGWRPLSTECDYAAITRRIQAILLEESQEETNLAAVEGRARSENRWKTLEDSEKTVLAGPAFSLTKGGV
jgi:AcrR family transcriptional regulator